MMEGKIVSREQTWGFPAAAASMLVEGRAIRRANGPG